MNILGTISSFDVDTDELKIKLAFITPEIEEALLQMFQNRKLTKLKLNVVKEAGTYGQQKRLFGSIRCILQSKLKRKPTANETAIFYAASVKAFFPVKMYMLGDEYIQYIPSWGDLSKSERDAVVERLQELYPNVDFEHY